MACRSREELVGKRFISVKCVRKLKVAKISEWEWRRGFVRAVSTRDTSNSELTVLVEFDDTGWKSREYIKVHQVFQEFLVEHTLSWVELTNASSTDRQGRWPALCFKPVVDRVGLFHHTKRPVEFLNDRTLCIVDDNDIIHYKGGEEKAVRTIDSCPEIIKLVKAWLDYQDGQKILLTTPTVLLGYRVEVYRTEGTTQWYTAVIKSYNHATKSLTLTDDTVLEEHNEDPALIQMHLIGDGVVDSILSGVDVGVAQRRRPRSTITRQNSSDSSLIINISRGISSCQSGNHTVTSAQTKPVNSVPTSSPCVATTNRSLKGSNTKLRAAKVEEVNISSSIATSAVKGKQETSPKQIPNRKSHYATKASTEPLVGSKDSCSEGNIETRSSVWKQTSNILVKQSKEESDKYTETKDNSKPRSPKVSHKGTQKKEPPDCEDQHTEHLEDIPSLGDSSAVKGASSGHITSVKKDSSAVKSTSSGHITSVNKDSSAVKSTSSGHITSVNKDSSAVKSTSAGHITSVNKDSSAVKSTSSGHITSVNKDSSAVKSTSSGHITSVNKDSSAVKSTSSGHITSVNKDSSAVKSTSPEHITSVNKDSSAVKSTSPEHITSVNKEKENWSRTKRKEKGIEGTASANACTETVDKKQAPSAVVSVLACENDKNLYQKLICDIGTKSDINLPAVVSSITNDILNSEAAQNSVKYSTETIEKASSDKYNENEDSSIKQVSIKVLCVKPDIVSDKKVVCPVGGILQDKSSGDISSDSSDTKSDEDMHYKKQILRAGSNINPTPNSPQAPSVSEGVDVSRLLTDQLSKGRNSEKCTLKSDDKFRSEVVNATNTLSSLVYVSSHRDNQSESNSLIMPHDASSERQSAFTSVQSSLSRSNQNTPTVIDRADSRSSDGQLSVYLSDNKQSNSRMDDVRSVKSSPGTSPLIVDRNETVNPYRDPDLMRTNPVHSHIQNILAAQHKLNQTFPSTHAPVLGVSSSQAATAFSNVLTLPARSMLSTLPSTLPYTSTHQLPPSISHHLTLPHGYPMDAVVRAQQQQLAALQQQHLMGYTLNTASTIASLEALWQRKLSAAPLPAHYVLKKNQESHLATEIASALHREHLQLQIDHGRREIERIEVERRERDRLEHERREKEHTEIIERERQEKERERAERERQERELIEKERFKRERQEWDYKQSQERILQEAVDTEAAVDQHFAESLTRLASQQGISMFPSIAHATGRGFIPKTEALHGLPQLHSLPFHEKKHLEHRIEDQLNKDVDPLPDDKRCVNKAGMEKSSIAASYSCGSSNYHSGSSLPPSSHKPLFNLYGYPSSHSTITAEQLKQRGLISEARHIKEEVLDKHLYSSGPPHTTSPGHTNQAYCLREVKQESYNSVIVKSDSKSPLKIDNPVAAHSHHSSPSSSSSSSPRPQHQWLAHAPEHRPDRPLSSTSPASGVRLHHLHHSSPVSTSFGHPPSSHNAVFSSSEIRAPPRSLSPYTPAASQSQPLNFCKTSDIKIEAPDQQQQPPQAHTSYTSAQTYVSVPNSVTYNYSLIQQGLVPNPIYSQGGLTHPAGFPHQHSIGGHAVCGPSANSLVDSKPSQVSPGSKRKIASKDSNTYNRKKSKGHTEISLPSQSISIPVTTPQIITNPSPYTTSSSSSILTRSETSSVTSSSPALISTSIPYSTGFMDSFKSFVENTVQIAFLQDEKKAQEKDRAQASRSHSPVGIPEADSCDRKLSQIQSLPDNFNLAASSATGQDVPQSNCESYNSRIMDTINRVANNQADTDSDTLSASSPPLQVKSSGTNSPSSRNCHIQSSSHPHHMKKAWLQRHDEDKKSETPISAHDEEDSNSGLSHTRDIISCIENPSASLVNGGRESRSASPANVVVTLPNGNVNELGHNDESTSSASESEMQSASPLTDSKKRAISNKGASGFSKKARSDVDSHSCTPSPVACNNSSSSTGVQKQRASSSKHGRADKQTKTMNDSQMMIKEEQLNSSSKHSHGSPQQSKPEKKDNVAAAAALESSLFSHLERSEPSPSFSENSSADMSPASSSSSVSSITVPLKASIDGNIRNTKDKKKQRPNKESSKDSKRSSSFNKPLVKMTIATLKRAMVPFVQDGPCSEITPKLNKCRECKMTPGQRNKKLPNIFCRFYAFRRLKYNARGIVTIDGFSDLSDADPDDIEPWLPRFPVQDPELDVENSKFIIAKVGDKFCELVEQEKQAKSWAGDNVKIVWKRAVTGVREMCDVCDTTLFNMHWVCHKCGFVVCLDCFKMRMKDSKKAITDDKWLTCSSNRQAHKANEMMLTQIIPSDALWELGRLIHDIRSKWSIPSNCPCGGSSTDKRITARNGVNQLLNTANAHKLPNGFGSEDNASRNSSKSKKDQEAYPLKNFDTYNPDTTSSPLSILADVASMEPNSDRDKSDMKKKIDKSVKPGDDLLEETEKKSSCSTLRELLTKTAGKPKVTNEKKVKKGSGLSSLDDIIQSVVERSCTDGGAPFKFLHYTPRLGGWKRELPIMVHSLTETSVLYPDVPHSWLCDGRLLRLHDAHHKGNVQIFQEQWKRGQPVLVSCANKKMNISLWKPQVFIEEFGHNENEVVNCRTGDVIIGHTMGEFWEGFESLKNRPTDGNNVPMLLKLKDWPPGDDFSELLPTRFQDLMNALPLPEYTQRNGKLNLASRLPDFLVRPDLGPKMYNAYGSSHFPKEGTTNLHLDISDAVNVMVYVGVPGDGPGGRRAQEEAAVKAIDDAGCDNITKRRVREVHEMPGALWHIYDAHDADKIRDFLNKVAKERGEIIEKDHDAIHDQSWYLDKELCDRLLREYGVQGYTIVQCLGDAIFIPAGAPHQVRNLHSCVKVAEDFVSPEHLNHCFRLTQEFRQLSETHSNHEDKLQVKNIIYHAVKDAIAVLRESDPDDE